MTVRIVRASALASLSQDGQSVVSRHTPHPDIRSATEWTVRRVHACEMEAKTRASAILLQANEEASRIRSSALADANRVFEEARKTGERLGYEEVMKQLCESHHDLEQRLNHATELVLLAVRAVSEKALLQELTRNDESLTLWVKHALQSLVKAKRIVLFVHPSHKDLLRLHGVDLQPSTETWLEIRPDTALTPTEVVVRSELGERLLSLSMQIETFVSALRSTVKGTLKAMQPSHE